MGQYYLIINVDKKEKISPWKLKNGAKLMEWAYNKNTVVLGLLHLLANDWKNNRVYVVGDYADLDNPTELCYKSLKNVLEEENTIHLYEYVSRYYIDKSKEVNVKECDYRYIYNHSLKKIIDLKKCPIEYIWWNEEKEMAEALKIAPLPLLLAMGNDRGSGDFRKGSCGYEYVGSWCDTASSIEVTKTQISGVKYERFNPNFTENSPMIPYENESSEIEKFIKRYKGTNIK